MKLNITPLSQRDPRWKDQRLGTKNGTTIGSDGCVVTSASMMYTFYGKPTMPDQLDNFLTDNKLYYDETGDGSANDNLWVPKNVGKWLQSMQFDRMVQCSTTPAPISEIKAYLDQGKPIFVWVLNNKVYHCVLAVGYEGNEIIVNDPWRGDTVRIDQRWGKSDLAILEVDFYSGQKPDTALESCLRQHADLLKQLESANAKCISLQDSISTLNKDLLNSRMDTEKALNDLKSTNRELTLSKNKLIDIQKILNS